MSGLHQACARAIYDAGVWDDTCDVPWEELGDSQRSFFLALAAAAIGVVLAEATRSIEMLSGSEPFSSREAQRALSGVLATLAALGDEA